MAYPHGTVPTTATVHPTPVYETLTMALVALVLWRMRTAARPGAVRALPRAGGHERFLVEFIRRNDDVRRPHARSALARHDRGGAVWLPCCARRARATGHAPARHRAGAGAHLTCLRG
jgi:phosphatidylglycerol:prolipoprotein diacylglycerol transferase